MAVAVTGIGLVSALGSDPLVVMGSLERGASGLRPHPPLSRMPGTDMAGIVQDLDLKPFLKRRKDRKLMARPSELALPAFGTALGGWPGDRVELGLFVGVGREPPDQGESEQSLVASAHEGRLDLERLAGPGRDLYPPLLPLQTLPNMALAHVSINLEIHGENGAWAGGPAAALRALTAAIQAVEEGRAPAALCGGTDSQVDRGSQRDRLRLGIHTPPGEAAAALLIEPVEAARQRGALILALVETGRRDGGARVSWGPRHHAALGDCGAADGAVAAVLAVARARALGDGEVLAFRDPGQPPVMVSVRAAR